MGIEFKSEATWWRENDKDKWETTNCGTAKELSELVITFKVVRIDNDIIRLILTINNYTSKQVSLPNIVNGIREVELNLDKILIISDPNNIINTKWRKGEYIFKKPLQGNSTVELAILIKVKEIDQLGNTTINIDEIAMDDNSPTLFKEISIMEKRNETLCVNNNLLVADHGTKGRKLGGIVHMGRFDTIELGRNTTIYISDMRIDPDKMYFDGSSLKLMTMNGRSPIGPGIRKSTYPVMFIKDNTEIETWWYIINGDGMIYVKASKSNISKGVLQSTTMLILN